jgi:hypothetical protein
MAVRAKWAFVEGLGNGWVQITGEAADGGLVSVLVKEGRGPVRYYYGGHPKAEYLHEEVRPLMAAIVAESEAK